MSKVKRREAHKNTPPKKQANYRNQQTFLTDISQHQWSKFQNKKTDYQKGCKSRIHSSPEFKK